MIKTNFLDVDDTMYDEVHPKIKAVLAVVECVSTKLGMPVKEVYDTFLLSKREIIHSLSGDPNQNNRAKWYECMLHNLNTTALDPQELSEMYWSIILDNIEVYYDFNYILPTLAKNYELYALTDEIYDIQLRKLNRLRVREAFQGIISSSHVGVVKPHPELFKYAMKIAGSSAETSLMIGDSPKKDIRGGKSVNMATGWLRRGRYSNVDLGLDMPDIVIDNYLSLPEQIRQFDKSRDTTQRGSSQ